MAIGGLCDLHEIQRRGVALPHFAEGCPNTSTVLQADVRPVRRSPWLRSGRFGGASFMQEAVAGADDMDAAADSAPVAAVPAPS